jgi:hypothetical protein
MKVTRSNIDDVVEGMQHIAEAMPDDTRSALTALTFTLVDLAIAAEIPMQDIHDGIDKALKSRGQAAKQVLS